MKITFNNVKMTKSEAETFRFLKAVFGGVKVERTDSSVVLTVDGRSHMWRKKNIVKNPIYTLLKSKSEKITFE